MNKDIALDENGDLKIVDGDFVIEESDQQHVIDVFNSSAGEFKEFPLVGFGAIKYLKGIKKENEFKRDLIVQLQNVGYENPTIDLSEGFENLNIKV
ncbi:MAG: hypothetical protein V3V28_08615 [Polaribacter sp.]|uniref:hypothetical protein n=1 Tax=Polaribacter sp. TaxID=1920175 RepID=UPI002F35465D